MTLAAERFVADRFRGNPDSERKKMLDMSAGIPDLITLGRGDPDLPTPAHIVEAARAAADKYTHYTAWSGLPQLRRAIARKLAEENGFAADPEQEIVVTVGAQEAIFLTMFAILSPGDEIIVPEPRYTPYDDAIRLAGGRMIPLPTSARNDFQIEAGDVARLITPRTRAILLISPNNPTGAVLSRESVMSVAELAKKEDLLIISDELYEKLVFDGSSVVSVASLPGMKERTITVNGFSKAYSMTGWRVGYVAAPQPIAAAIANMKYSVSICTPAISQAAALAALTGPQDCVAETVRVYDQRRRLAMQRLDALGIPYSIPRGTFYIFPDISKYHMTSFDFACHVLDKAHVLVFPGTTFGEGGAGYVRISLLVPAEQVAAAFDRMETVLREL